MRGDFLNLKVEYNKVIEFVSACLKYGNSKQQQINWNTDDIVNDSASDLLDFAPNPDVKAWLNQVDEEISPFLRNDIVFVMVRVPSVDDFCFKLVLDYNLENIEDFFEALEKSDENDLVKMIFRGYNTDIPFDSDDKLIKDTLLKIYNKKPDTEKQCLAFSLVLLSEKATCVIKYRRLLMNRDCLMWYFMFYSALDILILE